MPIRTPLTQHPDYLSARQEAIERLHKRGLQTTPGRVKLTARNILIDQYRKYAREDPRGNLTDLVEHLAKHAPPHAEDPYATERAELRRIEQQEAVALWQLFRLVLPTNYARAFELFELEEYTAAETAMALFKEGITASPVDRTLIRQWVYRTKVALRTFATADRA